MSRARLMWTGPRGPGFLASHCAGSGADQGTHSPAPLPYAHRLLSGWLRSCVSLCPTPSPHVRASTVTSIARRPSMWAVFALETCTENTLETGPRVAGALGSAVVAPRHPCYPMIWEACCDQCPGPRPVPHVLLGDGISVLCFYFPLSARRHSVLRRRPEF